MYQLSVYMYQSVTVSDETEILVVATVVLCSVQTAPIRQGKVVVWYKYYCLQVNLLQTTGNC